MNPHQQPVSTHVDSIPPRALLEGLASIYELVLVTDYDGSVLWLSNQLGELCGDTDFHVGRDAQSIIPELPALPRPDQVFTLRSRLRQEGSLSNVRVELAARNGDSIPVEVSILPVSSPIEDRPLFIVIARPSERPETQPIESTHGNEALAAVLDDAPDSILAVDARGFVAYANAATERLVGCNRDEILDRPVAALLDDTVEIERLVASLNSPGEVGDCDLKLTARDGSDLRVSASARATTLRDGTRRTILCLRDVRARHEEDEALRHRNDELEHCVQALAHDLRSPLVALLGFSRLLRQDYGDHLDDTGAHFVDRIEQAGRTMEDLIHDLLELSRIGQPGDRRSLIDATPVLQQLMAELKPRLDAAGIQLMLPESPPPVYCDRTRLYQVFSNLIGNAIDHMGTCEDAHVQVSIEDDGDFHHITVTDAGRGVPGDQHEQIFDAFRSLGPASDGRRGTGIGLAIVKKIAETHGGRVWLDSQPGMGARFHITLARR